MLTNNKKYDVISTQKGWYRIKDDSGDDYLYHPKLFEVMEESAKGIAENAARPSLRQNNPKSANIAVAGK